MTRRMLVPALLGSAFVIVLAGAAAAGSLPEAAPDEFAALPQVSSEELAQQRGGADYYSFDMGPVQENWAGFNTPVTGNPTGNISGAITGNSVHDLHGIATVMYNTGNNVVFNSATQLNITFK